MVQRLRGPSVLPLIAAALVLCSSHIGLGGVPAALQGTRAGRGEFDRPAARGGMPPARATIRDVVEGFYVSRMQQELDLDDDQFARVLPLLRRSLERRNELAQRQVRLMARLRLAIDQGGSSDAALAEMRQELDQTGAALRNVQQQFFEEVDPHLTETQRANLRIVQPRLENRIRAMIERSRNAAAVDR